MVRFVAVVATKPPAPPPRREKSTDYNRMRWPFEEGTLFKVTKSQIVREVDETLQLLGWTRLALAEKMEVQASAVTQSLQVDKGLQLTTLIRMADAMDCDVEVNFVRRCDVTIAIPADV